ncbi:unnamed protein product [Haemonchus placei]|uniref:Cytochrome P450 n=1 Tax=Haemonchus placei TaxID=6290 RepID=A0A0N4X7Z6_HAEPC|nr:unnamed protein product [Haemonchus placei]
MFLAQLMPSILDIPVLGDLVKGDNEKIMKEITNTVREDVEKALLSWDDTQQPECFVHAYYKQMKTNPLLSYDNLFNVCSDLFLAGMETTATTLRWSALILAKHQDVQAIGFNRNVCLNHSAPKIRFYLRCLIFSATVLELQRFANIIAINGTHRTVNDTYIGSVPVPADTLVLGQIYNVMANSPVYPAPEKFSPERFLMDDGVTPNKEAIEQFCPFSIGKRMCVGEGMAKMELFIGLITILQNFKVCFRALRCDHLYKTTTTAAYSEKIVSRIRLESMFAALTLFLFSVIVYYIWIFYANVKRYPKGPTPLPIVGNLLSIDLRKLHKYFELMAKDYGDVFTVWLPKPHVVIMKYDSIKEAFAKRGSNWLFEETDQQT